MNEQAFKLLVDHLSDIKSDIDDLRSEIREQNKVISKLKGKVITIATIVPFLVSMTYKKIDTPPKAVQENVEQIMKEIKENQ